MTFMEIESVEVKKLDMNADYNQENEEEGGGQQNECIDMLEVDDMDVEHCSMRKIHKRQERM